MKSTWSPEHGALVKSSYASTPFDDLPFFGGRKIKETGNSEIASLLIDAGIPGASTITTVGRKISNSMTRTWKRSPRRRLTRPWLISWGCPREH